MEKIFIQTTKSVLLPVCLFLATPYASLAESPINSKEDIINIITNISQWMYRVFFIVAVFYLLWAAFAFLWSKEPTDASKARMRVFYAVIAIVIALLSTAFSSIINSFLSS